MLKFTQFCSFYKSAFLKCTAEENEAWDFDNSFLRFVGFWSSYNNISWSCLSSFEQQGGFKFLVCWFVTWSPGIITNPWIVFQIFPDYVTWILGI